MKKKRLLILCMALVLLILASCGKDAANVEQQVVAENEKPEKNTGELSLKDKIALEEKREKEYNTKKDLRIIAGTRDVAEILSTIGYDNVVAVTDDATEFYPDAINIGKAENPNYDILKDLKADLFMSDSDLEYEVHPMDAEMYCSRCAFYKFSPEGKRNLAILDIAKDVGMKDIAMEIYGITNEDINFAGIAMPVAE